jgi:copper(I)-binding protein
VIAVACLLFVAVITTSGHYAGASSADAPFLAPLQSALRADPPACETTNGVPVSLLIRNDGESEDRLLSGSTPIAQCIGVRRAYLVNGRPATAEAPGGIVIPAGATVTLEPGKSHIALFRLRTDLVQGETFPLSLRFERAGEVTVSARVRRKVDAAGVAPLPEVSLGDLTIALASAPPAPVG